MGHPIEGATGAALDARDPPSADRGAGASPRRSPWFEAASAASGRVGQCGQNEGRLLLRRGRGGVGEEARRARGRALPRSRSSRGPPHRRWVGAGTRGLDHMRALETRNPFEKGRVYRVPTEVHGARSRRRSLHLAAFAASAKHSRACPRAALPCLTRLNHASRAGWWGTRRRARAGDRPRETAERSAGIFLASTRSRSGCEVSADGPRQRPCASAEALAGARTGVHLPHPDRLGGPRSRGARRRRGDARGRFARGQRRAAARCVRC